MPLRVAISVIAAALFEISTAIASIVSAIFGSVVTPRVLIEPSASFRSIFLEPGPSFITMY
jgi:hypothetical protein